MYEKKNFLSFQIKLLTSSLIFNLFSGHYRRILNKLPGCTVKKPPRGNRIPSNGDTQKLEDPFNSSTNVNANSCKVGKVYPEPLKDIAKLKNDTSDTGAYGHLAEHIAPSKPPRSPENVRKIENSPIFDTIESNFLPAISAATAYSLENIDDTVSTQKSERVLPTPAKTNEDLYDHVQSNCTSNHRSESYGVLNPKVKSLPSSSSWSTAGVREEFSLSRPSNFVDVSTASSAVVDDEYDTLKHHESEPVHEESSFRETQTDSSNSNDEIYDTVSSDSVLSNATQTKAFDQTTKDFQTAPPRVGKYEEISFENKFSKHVPSEKYEEAVFVGASPSNQYSRTLSLADSIYQTASDASNERLDAEAEPHIEPLSFQDNVSNSDPSVKRSKSFDIYDVASEVGMYQFPYSFSYFLLNC